ILSPKTKHTPENVHKAVLSLVQHQRKHQPATDETAQASVNRPTDPVTGANPFPEVTDLICRLPLPTLFYRLEAVHLGDLMRISGRPENTRHHRNRDALRKQRPYLRLNRFQGVRSLTREENSSSVSERRNQLGSRPKPSTQPPRPSYSLRPGDRQRTSQQRLGIGLSLKRHPFSGLVDSAAGTDFHGHRPAVYINQRLLWGLMSEKLGTLTQRLVHPTAPVLLTKNGPLGARVRVNSSIKKPRQHTH
ncbi:hypothetical protein OSTOST_12951, partial [Ostertagia ostertagi]